MSTLCWHGLLLLLCWYDRFVILCREIGKEDEDDEDYTDDVDDDVTDGSTIVSVNTKPSMSDQKILGTPPLPLSLHKVR